MARLGPMAGIFYPGRALDPEIKGGVIKEDFQQGVSSIRTVSSIPSFKQP